MTAQPGRNPCRTARANPGPGVIGGRPWPGLVRTARSAHSGFGQVT
jgi:hypothetical protein